MGAQDDILSVPDEGKSIPDRTREFRPTPIEAPDVVHQTFRQSTSIKIDTSSKIFTWHYDSLKKMFMIKRRGGDLHYFAK
jgi:hypothetical protein